MISGKFIFIIYMLTGFVGSISILLYARLIQFSGPVVGASAAIFGISATFATLNPDKRVLKSKTKHWVLALFIVNILDCVGLMCGLQIKKRQGLDKDVV